MRPRVSVITPAYNHAQFLPDALHCLQAQTLRDWEWIVIDDGSTDGTLDLLRRLATEDPRIRPVSQANRGLAATRNRGVALATAPFIQFLDADDLLAPDKLEAALAVLSDDPGVHVCYCNYRPLDNATGQLMPRWTDRMLGSNPVEDFLFRWELDLCIPIHCAVFRRDLWSRPEVFEERLRAKEDWLFWVDLALNGAIFHFIDRDQALYRMHGSNMSQQHGDMTAILVDVSMRLLLLAPEHCRERFLEASSRRVRRSIEHLIGDTRREHEAAITGTAGRRP